MTKTTLLHPQIDNLTVAEYLRLQKLIQESHIGLSGFSHVELLGLDYNKDDTLIIFMPQKIGTGIDANWLNDNYPDLLDVVIAVDGEIGEVDVPQYTGPVYGYDLNHYRRNYPYATVQPNEFMIFRSNFGVTKDTAIATEHPKIKEAGLINGIYTYLHPRHNIQRQIDAFLESLNTYKPDMPPIIDVEQNLNLDLPLPSFEYVRRMVEGLRANGYQKVIIYTNTAYDNYGNKFSEHYNSNASALDCELWAADWHYSKPKSPDFWREYLGTAKPRISKFWDEATIWQYGYVIDKEVYPSHVDGNLYKGTFVEFLEYIG